MDTKTFFRGTKTRIFFILCVCLLAACLLIILASSYLSSILDNGNDINDIDVEEQIAILNNPENDDMSREYAATLLGNSGDTRAIDPLIQALEDSSLYVQESAAEALGCFKEPKVVQPLIEALQDKNYSMRETAIIALGEVGDERAASALVPFLQERDMSVSAARSLEQIGWEPVTAEEKVYFYVANENKKQLLADWDTAKQVLLRDIDSDEYEHMITAVYALIELGNEDIIPDLIDNLNNSDLHSVTKADIYLNCGNTTLSDAAENWADVNGYYIIMNPGSASVTWGSW